MLFKTGDVVRNTSTHQIGVVVDDLPGILQLCANDEVLVVYDGRDCGCATKKVRLRRIGIYDTIVSDPRKCGVGKITKTCKYIVGSNGEFECTRFSSSRNNLLATAMNACGAPEHLFPRCQDDIAGQ